MKTFLCHYEFDGDKPGTWCFEIKADSHEDAVARLRSIRLSSDVDGELMMKIPASMGWFAKMLVAARNFVFGH